MIRSIVLGAALQDEDGRPERIVAMTTHSKVGGEDVKVWAWQLLVWW